VPLDDEQLTVFKELTGRDEAPSEPVKEAWLIMGRRSGKDVKAASIITYLATFGVEFYGFRDRLVPGERGVVQLLAVDRDQSKVCLGYVKAFFRVPALKELVANVTAEGVELRNGFAIEITTNDQRRVRGRTVVAAVLDEVGHWRSDNTVNPDEEVYGALKPAMATIKQNAMLIGISSPYARRGLLWKKYRKHYAQSGPILVVKAPTWRMNLTLPRDDELFTDALAEDPVNAAAEYGAEFRSDVEAFVPRDAVEATISTDVLERPPKRGCSYAAFCDPSGGSSDSMTLAIAHLEDEKGVLDAVRERRAPFSPESVVADFADLMKRYGVSKVYGDRYGGEWPREAFSRHGIAYSPSDKSKSDIYLETLPKFMTGQIDLLDNSRIVAQFCNLERRTSRSGKDSIDHPPGAHDDLANAVAGVLSLAIKVRKPVTRSVMMTAGHY
jgi:hypothetical protein